MTERLSPLDLTVDSDTPFKVTQGITYSALTWTWARGNPPLAATLTLDTWDAGGPQVWTVGAGLSIVGQSLVWELGLVTNAPGTYKGRIISDDTVYGLAFRSDITLNVL